MPTPALETELADWLRLQHTPGVSRQAARGLLAAFGSPAAVFAADASALEAVAGAAAVPLLANVPANLPEILQRCAVWLAASTPARPRTLLTLGDTAYPPRWLQSPDPPLLVFAAGRLELTARDAVAVVGSRHPTPQGLDNARAFSRDLGSQGWTVVSGLAMGIDGAAHEAALETAGGTVAVIGCGPDIAYPARHRALFDRIVEEGLLLSEFAPGTPPRPPHFPQRNRLIASLARGTLVVEAALQSGSLITARLALEVGADVFAIPGSIHSPQSRGCHALIQQGARLVESAQDVIDELVGPSVAVAGPADTPTSQREGRARSRPRPQQPPSIPGAGSGELWADAAASQDPLLEALGYEPVSLDALSARTGRSAADLGVRLLELELNGLVRRLPGQLFQRIGVA